LLVEVEAAAEEERRELVREAVTRYLGNSAACTGAHRQVRQGTLRRIIADVD
jgi:hypothetical protein